MQTMKRGEVWWVNFDPSVGGETHVHLEDIGVPVIHRAAKRGQGVLRAQPRAAAVCHEQWGAAKERVTRTRAERTHG